MLSTAMMAATVDATAGVAAYLGGVFTTVRSTTRNRAACVDATTGLLRVWSPDCNNGIECMVLSGSNLYLGGFFTTVGGTTRNGAACVDATSTSATPTLQNWNPNCNSAVSAMKLVAGNMYLGGSFTSVRGETRNFAAAVDASVTSADPTLHAWHPDCSGGAVLAIEKFGEYIYLGGNFTSVRGETRNKIASVSGTLTSANPTLHAWNPDCNGSVYTMQAGADSLYIGGAFTTVNGTARNHAACVGFASVAFVLRAWNPNCDSYVWALTLNSNDVYLGGSFTSVREETRNRAACVDAGTSLGSPTLRPWNPDITGNDTGFESNTIVKALIATDDSVYIGGLFNSVGVVFRKQAACVDKSAGLPRGWNPTASGGGGFIPYVNSIVIGS